MTTFATRSPLQLLTNPHMMSEARWGKRRSSARLAEKEDVPAANGVGAHEDGGEKPSKTNGASTTRTTKVAVNGTGGNTVMGARSKRKKEYDEEEDGFAFTRTKAKRAKATALGAAVAAASTAPTPIPAPAQVPAIAAPEVNLQEVAKAPAPKRTRKKSIEKAQLAAPVAAPVDGQANEAQTGKRRRSPRNSGDSVTVPEPTLVVKKKRQETATARSRPRRSNELQQQQQPEQQTEQPQSGQDKSSEALAQPQALQKSPVPTRNISTSEITKIALPFADTPIIRRNQEMRKGSGERRSSLGMRGRRASSLIESGKSNALPHDEVDSSEFYKHIESESLPEPRRMRQLLTWCGTRALGDKPSFASEDSQAKLAAREIQQQLLKDFSAKSELSDWFSRDIQPPPQPPQPNPKNIANLAKIEELEQKIASLQAERRTWASLLQQPPANTPIVPSFSLNTSPPSSESSLPSSELAKESRSRLLNITQNLEFTVDSFASNVHAIEQYREAADRVASGVLVLGARGLAAREREREKRQREDGEPPVGMRDVLRGLSRALER
ncbi:hypothetical protein MMC25_005462 [Agyrium rufum]|nr:hypothetical protein [Agyrium rufum]